MTHQTLMFLEASAWRAWLLAHHASETEAWLVIQRARSTQEGLRLGDAVEEALCFGWIDSTLQPVDEHTYQLRFSPRKPDSPWSMTNIERAGKLVNDGRMAPAGLAAVEAGKAGGQWAMARERERTHIIPEDLQAALEQVPGALEAYRELTDSKKKQFLYWLQNARKAATRARRIDAIVEKVMGQG